MSPSTEALVAQSPACGNRRERGWFLWSQRATNGHDWTRTGDQSATTTRSPCALRFGAQGQRTMSSVFQIRGTICGTLRTYGARHSEDAWRRCVVEGAWSGYEDLAFPPSCDLELEFSFRTHAASPDYGWNPHPNGCDLDTLVVQSSTCAAPDAQPSGAR